MKERSTTIELGTPYIEDSDKKQKKLRAFVKKELYIVLSQFLNKKSPWGTLTGIRPTKIVHALIEDGLNENAISYYLQQENLVYDSKAKLIIKIANNQRNILKKIKPNGISLYINIPFCPTRCLYCSFMSNPINKSKGEVDDYLNALYNEMEQVKSIINEKGYIIQSIYIGGGTPTAINSKQLYELLQNIENTFNLDNIIEYSLEAGRPDSLNLEKLNIIKQSKIDRISINPQTMNDKTLIEIGRKHTVDEFKKKYYLARELGFNNINMDIIAGLPKEDLFMFQKTLEEIKSLDPDSLTVHTMSIKRGSKLCSYMDEYNLSNEDTITRMVDYSYKTCNEMSLYPYYLYRQKNILGNQENIGYAKKGKESYYNIAIMEETQSILAMGAGAVTKVIYPIENRIERAFNVKSVEEYILRVDEMVARKRNLL